MATLTVALLSEALPPHSPPARPKAGAIGAKAAARYKELEKETTIAPVKYETFARPKETPIDLQGRPMVAPATD